MFTKKFPFIRFIKYNLVDALNFGSFACEKLRINTSTFDGAKTKIFYTNLFSKVMGFLGLYDFGKPFIPCAYYHHSMDMLVFQTKDCSYTLDETSNLGGILYENHTEGISVIGFQLYGIRYFLQKKDDPELFGEWSVPFLVKKIVAETEGGSQKVFGKNHSVVTSLLAKYQKLEVTVTE